MPPVIRWIVFLGVVGLGAAWFLSRPDHISEADIVGLSGDAQAGEAVFWAAGCASCHSREDAQAEERLVLAGGQAFPSDFGTFRAPNISSDPTHGIGDWTLAQFLTALQNGVSPDGQQYYPAFPYTAYRLADRQDLADLFAFMQTLPASDTPSLPHDVGFPFNIRRTVGLWNQMFLHDDFAVTFPLSDDAPQGRYLAEALGHCAECHTPRNALGALDRSRWMHGAPNPSGRGTIPALTPDQLGWARQEIAAYLNDGFTPEFDTAGGHMRSVIQNLSHLTEADRLAIASYLLALPPMSGRP
ncbi:cytochrome c [Jannaschia sp. CCS1]|uniref:cytochrome c n=1 Tax=Jannaschia sp. (strain CCS1) TaxID=290400 RepID=UPI000053B591|nr:cytochrome c [Jannaschia sp. CCS1]ABD55145.1 diheme cytochrome c-type [Jannaschia sp. CCS1]